MTIRRERVGELVKELAAEYIGLQSNQQSLITVTRADVSPDLRKGTVYFTVFPTEHEERALHFIRRNRSEFRKFLTERLSIRRIPFVDFEIDLGEKNRQRIDELSNE